MTQAVIFDPRVLRELYDMMGGEKALLEDLIGTFEQDTPLLLQELSEAVAHNDSEQLERAAHPLKSSSASLGAMRLSAQVTELETLGRQIPADQLGQQVVAIHQAYQDGCEQMQQFLNNL